MRSKKRNQVKEIKNNEQSSFNCIIAFKAFLIVPFSPFHFHGAAVVFFTQYYAISDRRFYNDSKYWDSTKNWTTMVEEAEQMKK